MCRPRRLLSRVSRWLLAALVVALLPAAGRAETITIRNETPVPVIVETVSVYRNMLRRERPYVLNPGDATPGITLPGNKIVTVRNARMVTQVLSQQAIPARAEDQYFGIVFDPILKKVKQVTRPPFKPTTARDMRGPAKP
jgi:hypothetical protein